MEPEVRNMSRKQNEFLSGKVQTNKSGTNNPKHRHLMGEIWKAVMFKKT